jgi:hypothetical protein
LSACSIGRWTRTTTAAAWSRSPDSRSGNKSALSTHTELTRHGDRSDSGFPKHPCSPCPLTSVCVDSDVGQCEA